MNFRKHIITPIAILIVLSFAGIAAANLTTAHTQLETKKVELQSTQDKIKLLQLKYGDLESKLQKAEASQTTNKDQIDQLEQQKNELDRQLQTTKAQLQAKADIKRNTVSAASVSKEQLMLSAGITAGDHYYADWLINKESSWNPNAVNPSSGACGLAQALPCSKLGPNWNDTQTALTWMSTYVKNRYGTWYAAVQFHKANNWY